MNENYTVYMHRFPNGKVYIGITCQRPEARWRNGEGYKGQVVYSAVKKYGWENAEHIILFSGLTKKEAEEKEIEQIAIFRSNKKRYGYNVDNGGNCEGTHSQETRDKIAESNRRRVLSPETGRKISAALKGRKMPEDIKKKISETLKGRVFSEETREKMGDASRGRTLSQEARNKIRAARIGKANVYSNPEERGRKISQKMKVRNEQNPDILLKAQKESVKKCSKPILQRNKDGEMVATWKSAAEIERAIGINHAQISRACRTNTICHGYYWVFL